MKIKRLIIGALVALTGSCLFAKPKTNARAELGPPDMDAIAAASVDENSQYYYPKLYKAFMSNDTTMTATDFQYFYYGTLSRKTTTHTAKLPTRPYFRS